MVPREPSPTLLAMHVLYLKRQLRSAKARRDRAAELWLRESIVLRLKELRALGPLNPPLLSNPEDPDD